MAVLLLTHAVAWAAWVLYTRWETRRNVALIAANGSRDTLKEGFHRLRMLYRVAVGLLLAFASSLPLWHQAAAMGLSMGALLAAFGGYFTRVFNPALNMARGKERFYASVQPRAALFPDRVAVAVAKRCERAYGDPWMSYLPHAYEVVLNVTAGICAIGYLAALATVWWLWL